MGGTTPGVTYRNKSNIISTIISQCFVRIFDLKCRGLWLFLLQRKERFLQKFTSGEKCLIWQPCSTPVGCVGVAPFLPAGISFFLGSNVRLSHMSRDVYTEIGVVDSKVHLSKVRSEMHRYEKLTSLKVEMH
jgi:hypothetical protein